ncbi:hypothetical protein JCM8097_000788 [Rhodosporidiobolus ruineniae]
MYTNATELLFGANLLLPQGTNVFAYLYASLQEAVYPPLPRSFTIQVTVLAVLSALRGCTFAAAFLVRFLKTRQPPFRLVSTVKGTFFVPHFTLSWQLLSVVFDGLLVAYCIVLRKLPDRDQGVRFDNYDLWVAATWTLIWVSAMLATTTLGMKDSWYSSAAFVNTAFLVPTVACTASNLICASIAQYRYNHFLDAYDVIQAALLADAAIFTSTTPVATVQAQLTALIDPMQTFLDHQAHQDVFFRAMWACWTFAGIVLVVTYLIVGPRYFRRLLDEIKLINSHPGERITPSMTFKRNSRRSADPRDVLYRAYMDMILGSTAIAGGGLLYTYLAALICTPASIFGLLRAVQHSSHRPAVVETLMSHHIAPSSGKSPKSPRSPRSPRLPHWQQRGSRSPPSSPSTASFGFGRSNAGGEGGRVRSAGSDLGIEVLRSVRVEVESRGTGEEDATGDAFEMMRRQQSLEAEEEKKEGAAGI